MVINFFGKRGSGKTTVIKGQLQDCRGPVVIIDILGNFDSPDYVQSVDISDCIQKVKEYYIREKNEKSPQDQKIFNLKTHDYNLAIDYISACLWEINGGTLVLDEVDCFEFSEAPCFDQIIRYGRNHSVDIITGCRRPAELSRNITAAANKFYCFGTHEPRDIVYFQDIFGYDDAVELMRVPKHSGLFLDYDSEIQGRFKVDAQGGIHHTFERSLAQGENLGEANQLSENDEPVEGEDSESSEE